MLLKKFFIFLCVFVFLCSVSDIHAQLEEMNEEIVEEEVVEEEIVEETKETEEIVDAIVETSTEISEEVVDELQTEEVSEEVIEEQVIEESIIEKPSEAVEEVVEPPSQPAPSPVVQIEEGGSNSVDVQIKSTSDPNVVYGTLTLTEEENGLLVEGKLAGVPGAGKHGLHIHANGSCADGGAAAGRHFNPDKRDHGYLGHGGHSKAQAGDMGNVQIDQNGDGAFSFLLRASSLHEGKYNVAGASIVLHEKEDDLISHPEGNSGARIGCGVIPVLDL